MRRLRSMRRLRKMRRLPAGEEGGGEQDDGDEQEQFHTAVLPGTKLTLNPRNGHRADVADGTE